MANHCFNYIQFFGRDVPKVAAFWQKELIDEYKEMKFLTDLSLYTAEEKEAHDVYKVVGTKWIDTDYMDEEGKFLSISCSSAWGPPVHLVQRICKAFGVTGEIEFEESGCDFAGYERFDDQGDKVDSYQGTVAEYKLKEGDPDEIHHYVNDNVEWMEQEDLDPFLPFLDKEHINEFQERLGKEL